MPSFAIIFSFSNGRGARHGLTVISSSSEIKYKNNVLNASEILSILHFHRLGTRTQPTKLIFSAQALIAEQFTTYYLVDNQNKILLHYRKMSQRDGRGIAAPLFSMRHFIQQLMKRKFIGIDPK